MSLDMGTARADAPGRSGQAAGWPLLLRLALRQDRVLLGAALAGLTAMVLASAVATPSLYADTAARVRAAEGIDASPAIVALYGPIVDVTSEGELAMTKLTVLYAVVVAALFVVVVRRHTRVEEESGRSELVGGSAVGRQAPVVATGALVVVLGLGLALCTALAAVVGGLEPTGSLAFAGVWAGTGLIGAGVGALTAQVAASARTCAAYAAAVLAVLYLARAVGDTAGAWSWLSWVSPLGWNTKVQAFGETRWWLLALYPVVGVALLGAAWALRERRDLGSGLVAARPGPARGAPRFGGVGALGVRAHAVALTIWSGAVLAGGAVFGAIAPGVGDLLDSAVAQDVIDRLGGQLIAALLSVLAVVLGYFAASVAAHAGRDESEGRLEVLLATATSRGRWFAATTGLALLGTAWLLLLTGLGLALGYHLADGPAVGDLVLAALAWTPAAWVVAALGLAGIALGGRWRATVWLWPAGFVSLTLIADALSLPAWVGRLSPYTHAPALPGGAWTWTPSVVLCGVTAALLGVSWWRLRSRDIG